MRRVAMATITAVLLCGSLAYAAGLTITVPDAAVAEATARCDELRVQMRARSLSNPQCAAEFLRRGLRNFIAQQERRDVAATAQQQVRTAIQSFDEDFPVDPAIDISDCGDGTTDTEFGETCDDSNTTPGDGCDASCQTEP